MKTAWLENRTTAGFPCAEADGRAGGYFQCLAGWHGIQSRRPRRKGTALDRALRIEPVLVGGGKGWEGPIARRLAVAGWK